MKKTITHIMLVLMLTNLIFADIWQLTFTVDTGAAALEQNHTVHIDCRDFENVNTAPYDMGPYDPDRIFFDTEVNRRFNRRRKALYPRPFRNNFDTIRKEAAPLQKAR